MHQGNKVKFVAVKKMLSPQKKKGKQLLSTKPQQFCFQFKDILFYLNSNSPVASS